MTPLDFKLAPSALPCRPINGSGLREIFGVKSTVDAKKPNQMRLSPAQIDTIRQAARQNFGADALIWLFGSRADDSKRGGDVDLYVESTHRDTLMSALRCKISLEDSLDLPVDLIVKEPGKDKPIYNLAKSQGVRL